MPDFKTHKKINFIIIIIIAIFLFYKNIYNSIYNNIYLLFIFGYYVGTIYITPDLDINSKPSNNWFWWIYKKISHHRGKTHSLFYGFLFPIIYILFIIIGIIYIVEKIMNIDNLLLNFIIYSKILLYSYYEYIIMFIVGIGISNGIHILLDKVAAIIKNIKN